MRRRIECDYTWQSGSWQETAETHFIYDGNAVVEEQNASNVPLVSYTRGISGLLARTTSSQELPGTPSTAFYHADGNGNITALMYPSGQLAAKYLYDSFGNMLAMSGPLASFNKYRFSSKEWNDNAGLYYFGRRFYDPILQRWINRDPIQESGGLNLYGFVANDPIDTIDILGYCDPSLWDLFWGNMENNWTQNLQDLGNGLELGAQKLENAADSFASDPVGFSSNFDSAAGNQIADAVAWALGGDETFANNVSAALSSLETSQGIGQALFGAEAGLAGGALLDAATPEAVAAGLTGGGELAEDAAEAAGLGSRVAAGAAGSVEAAGAAAEAAAAETTAARTASGDFYSVAFQTTLDPASYPGLSRAAHFQEANEALLTAMESDPQFAQTIQQAGVNLDRTATGLAPRTPPEGWTWHHAEDPGVMQLVPSVQHTPGSIFWDTLHPGGQGGYAIWGK